MNLERVSTVCRKRKGRRRKKQKGRSRKRKGQVVDRQGRQSVEDGDVTDRPGSGDRWLGDKSGGWWS